MSEFVAGQRWINDAELNMGLGTVLDVEHRTVSIIFHAVEETRTYAKDSAPLTRIRFNIGDEVSDIHKRKLKITDVSEYQHLLTYSVTTETGNTEQLEERDLDTAIQLNKPLERLQSGQIDDNKWFTLRYQSWLNQITHFQSGLTGLTGARTSLIPHQLYIANEVASRYAPRVLLADEVGLGKTIEAGMILHQQLSTGRASRVLIIVPEPLVNQWLVELLRRFNLFFNIYDEERCQAISESTDFTNPFNAEQQILCSLSLFSENPERFQQAISSEWDLLIIDEAHHLEWSKDKISEEYKLVEQLARTTRGLLLLTATPEQFGKESHFARLRLLDADRFSDYDSFLQQEEQYQGIADLIDAINADKPLAKNDLAKLKTLESHIDDAKLLNATLLSEEKNTLIHHLLDCHGTGRVLFRNTRMAIKGFPERKVSAYALPLNDAYKTLFDNYEDISQLLHAEHFYTGASNWTSFDPRVDWLVELLNHYTSDKILLICHYAETAIALSKILKTKYAIATSVFHENLSIIERDKCAADFADQETGVQLLMCSEIGSEGRNFQFASHLVLFDLPLNPDLLEQRIGRLDRIGQKNTIHLHVPYFENTSQHRLYAWYHQALNAFKATCPAGAQIFADKHNALVKHLALTDTTESHFNEFVERCKQQHENLNREMHEGRDRLLEYSSCRKDIANKLKNRIEAFEHRSQLKNFMLTLFDSYGVNVEDHKPGSYIISPAEHMIGQFPGLSDDGMTITFDREVALVHDDMHFLSWEHPLVINGIDMLLGNELGNTAACSIKDDDFKPGQLLIQFVVILSIDAPAEHNKNQSLPPLPLLITLNENTEEISLNLSSNSYNAVDRSIAKQIVQLKEAEIKNAVNQVSKLISEQAMDYLNQHYMTRILTLENEIERLVALQQINPQVRNEEIDFFRLQLSTLKTAIQKPVHRIDSIRLIITT